MDIFDFINKYKNHPVLFIGTGFSLRYLKNSYSWEDLLKHIATELKGNNEFFLDLKGSVYDRRTNTHDFMKLASLLQSEFNQDLSRDRNGKFKHINDKYYKLSEMGVNSDRFKIYISEVLSELLDTVKEITSGGSIKVSIAEDLDDLKNSERILAISPTFKSTIEYTYKEPAQLIEDYFKIIDSKDFSLIKIIDKMKISKTQWFPIFGFSSIVLDLQKESLLKEQQIEKIKDYITKNNFCRYDCIGLKSIIDINASTEIAPSYKEGYIFHCFYNDKFNLEEIEQYLISIEDKRDADYKKLLCLYDWKKYKIAD